MRLMLVVLKFRASWLVLVYRRAKSRLNRADRSNGHSCLNCIWSLSSTGKINIQLQGAITMVKLLDKVAHINVRQADSTYDPLAFAKNAIKRISSWA
jgi:hypothetical protein